MAYDRLLKFEQAKDEIAEEGLVFIEDVCVSIGITKQTYYEWWPTTSVEYAEIYKLLEKNRIKEKRIIRGKLLRSDKATELIALYKLIGTDDDRAKLSTHRIDHTTKGDKLPANNVVDLTKLSDETLAALKEAGMEKDEDEF